MNKEFMTKFIIHLTTGNLLICRKIEIVNGKLLVDDSRELDYNDFTHISVRE